MNLHQALSSIQTNWYLRGAKQVREIMVKVLFVDNDAVVRMIAKKSIEEHWESKVVLAVNGAEAVRMAAKEMPALIILDVIMPGLDGPQTLSKLREQGIKAPVIFITAKEDFAEISEFKNSGVVGVLKKPFEPRQLLEECSKVLDKKAL